MKRSIGNTSNKGGTVAIMHEGRKLNYSIFNKLAGLQQNEIVENKRLGSVLAHI